MLVMIRVCGALGPHLLQDRHADAPLHAKSGAACFTAQLRGL